MAKKKKPAPKQGTKLFDLKIRWSQRFAYLKVVNPQDVIDDIDASVSSNIQANEPNDWLIHRYLVWLAATDDGQVTDCEWEGYDDLTKVEQRLYEWIDEHHPSCYATVYDLDEHRELDFERTSGIRWQDAKLVLDRLFTTIKEAVQETGVFVSDWLDEQIAGLCSAVEQALRRDG